MRITTIINGKGGVGKTTTAHALATGLDKAAYKTLAIDYDPQGNLSHAFGVDANHVPTLYHVFRGDLPLREAIQHTAQGDIIAGNAWLSQLEAMFSGASYLKSIRKLKTLLSGLENEYTHVFIDNQPLIGGILTTQSLASATDLIVPIAAEVFALQGLARLQEAVEEMRDHISPNLRIDGVLLTKLNPRTNISAGLTAAIAQWAEREGTKVYRTFIRESVSVKEAQVSRQSLFDFAPESHPAKDYLAFIQEYI